MESFRIYLESDLRGQIAYHGTNKEFESFDSTKFGQRDYGDFGFGVYLSSRDSLARNYAFAAVRHGGGKPILMKVRMFVENTVIFDSEFEKQVSDATNVPFPKKITNGIQTRPRHESEAITKYVVGLGYDSSIARNGMEIIVYDPSKLKIESSEVIE